MLARRQPLDTGGHGCGDRVEAACVVTPHRFAMERAGWCTTPGFCVAGRAAGGAAAAVVLQERGPEGPAARYAIETRFV